MDPQKILDYGAKLIVIFMCIPIHEYAHAWAATKLGDDTPRYQGRLSLNPLAHLDPIGALCIFFIGFGWGKPVQVNPIRFKNYRKGMALTAAAGPISPARCHGLRSHLPAHGVRFLWQALFFGRFEGKVIHHSRRCFHAGYQRSG